MKHRSGPALYSHGTRGSIGLVVGAVALVLFGVDGNLFVHTLGDMHEYFWNFKRAEAAEGAVRIEINAHQWYWNFNITYINETKGWYNSTGNFTSLNTTGAFTLKAGLTVKIILRSFDVNHAFWLVPFDLKIDVIPGHSNTYWLQPLQPGDYAIRCAEFCGLNHYSMTATLHVVK